MDQDSAGSAAKLASWMRIRTSRGGFVRWPTESWHSEGGIGIAPERVSRGSAGNDVVLTPAGRRAKESFGWALNGKAMV